MVDLAALQAAAAKPEPYAVVSRRYLSELAREISECRAARALQQGEQAAIAAIEARAEKRRNPLPAATGCSSASPSSRAARLIEALQDHRQSQRRGRQRCRAAAQGARRHRRGDRILVAPAAHSIAGGKKSTELGGCKIGLRTSRPKLAHGFESDDKAIEALRGTRWAKRTTRVSYSLDRTGTLKLLQLGGKAAADVASLGFSIEQGERFFLGRTG
jgi:hypothetical protein